jgi:hypothetical protein
MTISFLQGLVSINFESKPSKKSSRAGFCQMIDTGRRLKRSKENVISMQPDAENGDEKKKRGITQNLRIIIESDIIRGFEKNQH